MHNRTTVLMIEPQQPESISVRKLVIETAKHNVITAYGGGEGLSLFRKFPRVDAVVVHAGITDLPCSKVAAEVREQRPEVPIFVLAPNTGFPCLPADHIISSHDPGALLHALEHLNG